MENSTRLQLMQAVVFFSAGIAIGLVYDVCRAIRRCSGPVMQSAVDALFVFGSAVALYILGMWMGHGQLRLFMVGCLSLGAAVYSSLFSSTLVPVFCVGMRGFRRAMRIIETPLIRVKIFLKNRKKLFPKRWVWSKMDGYSVSMRQFVFKGTQSGKAAENTRETDRMDRLHPVGCDGGVRRVEYSSSTVSADASGRVSYGAERTDCETEGREQSAGAGNRAG